MLLLFGKFPPVIVALFFFGFAKRYHVWEELVIENIYYCKLPALTQSEEPRITEKSVASGRDVGVQTHTHTHAENVKYTDRQQSSPSHVLCIIYTTDSSLGTYIL